MLSFELAARVVGGIGLFLLGMRLMTEGLRVAAGDALRSILTRSTKTRLRGISSGFLLTALVQSSSAVTVATIGFVNAGLLNLAQAMAVTYGSNVGTTMTGWLVAAVGFHVNVRALALPLIGIGMLLRILVRDSRIGPIGEAIAGFGIFFLGIDVLRAAFEGLGDQLELGALIGSGAWRSLLLVVVGFALTLLMQSSSAAIAIILTAVGGGAVPLGSGAALVIGANVGTTSTAGLAVIGATANAKRVAAGHVAFNLMTGVVALLLLPFLLLAIDWGRDVLHLGTEPVAVLAAFHTLFNLLGVALILPLTNRLITLLEGWFRTAEEDDATPRYLDRNVLATPRLALDAMVLELTRVGQIARRLARAALSGDPRFQRGIPAGRQSLSALIVSIGDYIQRLQRASLPAGLAALLPTTIRVSRHYSEAAELASMVAAGRVAPAPPGCGPLEESLMHFVADADALVECVGIDIEGYEAADGTEQVAELKERYKQLKAALLDAGARGVWPVHHLVATLDWLSNVRRLVEQIERGARYLASLDPLLEDVADEEKEDAEALGDEAP